MFFFLYAKTDTSLACVSGIPGVVHVPNISAFTLLLEMDSPTAATPRNVVSFKLYLGYYIQNSSAISDQYPLVFFCSC